MMTDGAEGENQAPRNCKSRFLADGADGPPTGDPAAMASRESFRLCLILDACLVPRTERGCPSP